MTLHDFNVFPGIGAGLVAFGRSAFSHDIAAAIEDAVLEPVDVINMSLGGGVQGPHDFLADASDAVIVTADYTTTSPANGCTAISTALAGKIALIDRGDCTFTTKIRNAETAGAIGVLIVNNVAGDPIAMADDGTDPFPAIPAAMVGKTEGNGIKPSGSVSIDGTFPSEVLSTNDDIIAGFSPRGPTPFTALIKPDATAPGVNVYSSVFSFGPGGFGDVQFDFALFQGTSMSTPHIAGSAALLLDLHPDWSPADIRSALVNRAARTVTDHVNGAEDPGVLARGGGRIALPAANDTPLTSDPATASFGFSSGNKVVGATLDLLVRNVSGGDLALLRVPWWVRIDRRGKP